MINKIILMTVSIAAIIGVFVFSGSRVGNNDISMETEENAAIAAADVPITKSDLNVSSEGAEVIDLNSFSDTLTITNGGDYILTGKTTGGIYIGADEDENVHLILQNADISNRRGSAIFVQSANKVIVTSAADTVNSISDSTKYDSETEDACIYSRVDITFNGEGVINIRGYKKYGVHTSDILKIVSGNVNIVSNSKGLFGRDGVIIAGGNVHIESKGDGIYTNRIDREDRGFVRINGGNVEIISGSEGIQAVTLVHVSDCSLFINSVKEHISCQSGTLEIDESCVTS